MVKLLIGENEAGQRVDRFLKKYLKAAPLSVIYKTIRKDLKVNGKRVKEDRMLEEGDELSLYIPDDILGKYLTPAKRKPSPKQFKVAYEDENILVVAKPQGLLTHGDSTEKKNTLVNQVLGYLQENGDYNPSREKTFTPAPVNRLDRNTTGLVIFGKKAASVRNLTKCIRERDHVSKYYMTVVSGKFTEQMVIDESLEKDHETNVVSVAGDGHGKKSKTIITPVNAGNRFSMVEVELVTGRTHQIRAHLAHKGYPLIGDVKYGSKRVNDEVKRRFGITTQLLHAYKLKFDNMEDDLSYLSGKVIEIPLNQEFNAVMEALGR